MKNYKQYDLKHHPSTPVMVRLKELEQPVTQPKGVLGCAHNLERWIEWDFSKEPEDADFDNYPTLDKVAEFGDNMRIVCPRGCEDIHIRIGMDRTGL